MAGLSNLEEASQESKPYRMIRDNRDVEEGYHCHSGRAASSDVKDDLINVVSKGTTWANEFRQECIDNPVRFEKTIKRRKSKNFTTDAKKMNIPQKDLKVKEVLCTKDIWGRLVYLAAVQNLEWEHVMTMVPLSLVPIGGAMNRTEKSSLMKKTQIRNPGQTESYCVLK